MILLNLFFVLFSCTALSKAEQGATFANKKIAAFRVRSSWSADSSSTTSTSFLTPEVINAMCKDTTGKEDGSSKVEDNKGDESNNKQGDEETTKTEETITESDSSMSKSDNNKSSCFNCFAPINNAPYQLPTNVLSELENCSQIHLTEGSFKTCAEELTKPSDDATDVATSRRTTTQHKTRNFSECVYAQMKREMMQTCIDEVAIAITDNTDKIQQFLNTTTCVLAKFRCANFGASTGASRVLGQQQQTVAALAVATSGELHVFRVPDITQGLGWTQTKFSAAEWPGAMC